MSYRFKGSQVIIEGDINKVVPQTLPASPVSGQLCIDSADDKLKVWNVSLSRWILLGDAIDVVFDNTSNGFSAATVQEAIEEAQSSIAGKTFSITITHNGTIGNNTWVGFTEVIPGNNTPFYIHRPCILEDITFSNNRHCDVDFDFYKNGTAGGDIIKTWSIRDLQYTSLISQTDSFTTGDLLRIRARTSGLIGSLLGVTPNDAGIILIFRYT